MNILIACEFSGIVRDAFKAKGHYAVSCDLLPTERPGLHFQNDVRILLKEGWDMMIAHPPCTYLCNSGVKHLYIGGRKVNGAFPPRWEQMIRAVYFFEELLYSEIPRIAVENPIMHPYASERMDLEYSQIIQPWQHGHGETKATCLWLRGLPELVPSKTVSGRKGRVHGEPPSVNRWKNRSRTLPGIAAAMADQWG